MGIEKAKQNFVDKGGRSAIRVENEFHDNIRFFHSLSVSIYVNLKDANNVLVSVCNTLPHPPTS